MSKEVGQEEQKLNAWAVSLGDKELDYLVTEAHQVLASQEQRYSALDSKVVAIVGWAIVGIGTLLIAGDLRFDASGSGIASMFVIFGSAVAVLSGVFALWPRDWASEIDLKWFTDWQRPHAHLVKSRTLAALIRGSTLNREVLNMRNTALQFAVLGLVIEFAALVATLVIAVACD